VRQLACKFAQKLGVSHKFSYQQEMAGYAELASFLERNLEVSIGQAEGLSLSRTQEMNRKEINNFF
jgi:hypothetical protein